jgi:ribokinase
MVHLLVIGGAVLDIGFTVDRWPKPGGVSTVQRFSISPGGKGLNQAVAARRLGADVDFATCIGDDDPAEIILAALDDHDLSGVHITRTTDHPTNVVGVIVEDAQPGFMGRAGSSFALTPPDIDAALATLTPRSVLLLNFEVAEAVIDHALRRARAVGATTVLNPAPLHGKRPQTDFWANVDYLIPNEMEANTLLGTNAATPDTLIDGFLAKGVRHVVLTLGAEGSHYATADGHRAHVPAFTIEVVDTTGASDAFCAMFAVEIAAQPLAVAVQAANAAGAAACLVAGALPAMPDRAMVAAIRD